jgi:hypothetical protein
MRSAIALIVAPLLLTACASTHRSSSASLAERSRASCERAIYHTGEYEPSTGLRCAQVLGVWE